LNAHLRRPRLRTDGKPQRQQRRDESSPFAHPRLPRLFGRFLHGRDHTVTTISGPPQCKHKPTAPAKISS
jgi:hypothetical protein